MLKSRLLTCGMGGFRFAERARKIRGAYNKLSQMKESSVVAVSSGNHGIATAFSARVFGKKCTVILPENPVQEKAEAITEYGAQILKSGKYEDERVVKANQITKETGAALVHPFNDPAIIAGQGTCGLEIAEQLADFDSLVVPVGGAGLISGISIAVKAKKPSAKVFGVEPVTAAKLQAALRAGKVTKVQDPHSIADGLIPPSLGDLTYEARSRYVDGVLTVSDDEILAAMRLIMKEARIFLEPSAAASVAALLAGRDTDRLGKRVVFVISGGNVSQKLLAQILAS